MNDLEKEFQDLMQDVIKQINERHAKGEITQAEADSLIEMVGTRMVDPDTRTIDAWSGSSSCYDDSSWSSSSLSC